MIKGTELKIFKVHPKSNRMINAKMVINKIYKKRKKNIGERRLNILGIIFVDLIWRNLHIGAGEIVQH